MGLLCLEKTHGLFHTKSFRTAKRKSTASALLLTKGCGFLPTSGLKRSLKFLLVCLFKKKKKRNWQVGLISHLAGLHGILCISPRSSSTSVCYLAGPCTMQSREWKGGGECKHYRKGMFWGSVWDRDCICNVFKLKMDTNPSQVSLLAKVRDVFLFLAGWSDLPLHSRTASHGCRGSPDLCWTHRFSPHSSIAGPDYSNHSIAAKERDH